MTIFNAFLKWQHVSKLYFEESVLPSFMSKRCKFNANLWTMCFVSYKMYPTPSEALNTFGNCQRPVFSLGVNQHVYKLPVEIWTQWSSELRANNGRKTPFSHKLCAFRCLNLIPQLRCRILFKYFFENYSFLKNYVTSEGAVCLQCVILLTALHCSLQNKCLC